MLHRRFEIVSSFHNDVSCIHVHFIPGPLFARLLGGSALAFQRISEGTCLGGALVIFMSFMHAMATILWCALNMRHKSYFPGREEFYVSPIKNNDDTQLGHLR